MPGMARPDAVIVVLNSTNLHSHLVLAGRVIALGLPTLVLLNMADELHKQDGGVDVLSLGARSWALRLRWSARPRAQGLEACHEFPFRVRRPLPEPLELPVIGSTRSVREWAVRVGENANYRRPATPVWTSRLDNVFLHRIWGPVIFARCGDRGLPDDLCGRDSRCRICCRSFSTSPARASALRFPTACSARS